MNDKSVSRSQPSSYAFNVTKLDGAAPRQILIHAGTVAIAKMKAVRYICDDEILCAQPVVMASSTESGR